ncbi:MAG: hypothetical protein R3190_16985, partial [Thermoanaerobaculia bacterium]|nr:hypothetical protein [Thermoanaerobaculia bacterium]
MTSPQTDRRSDSLFGHIALECGAVTVEQLAQATGLQAREGFRRKLGEIFLDQGWIDSDTLMDILSVQREWKPPAEAEPG